MTLKKKQAITNLGLDRLQRELDELKNVKRKEVIERIKASRCFGLIENSDYETAREDQGFIEGRIFALENIIQNVEVIDQSKLSMKVIEIGHTVKIQELPNGDYESYTIVGSVEADPINGKISDTSPIAKQILGRRVGEKVNVKTPNGNIMILICSIS
ncbi:MAG: transcription elongation factor GreA [Melioribacteraceae bacterium]|nr:transcription elongation factor GreA [Melioribacteraceae bacterium]